MGAVPNIISSLDLGSCQSKLLCVRCQWNVICSFYYIIILNSSVLILGSVCLFSVLAVCACYILSWTEFGKPIEFIFAVKQNWSPLTMKILSIIRDSAASKYLGKHTVSHTKRRKESCSLIKKIKTCNTRERITRICAKTIEHTNSSEQSTLA